MHVPHYSTLGGKRSGTQNFGRLDYVIDTLRFLFCFHTLVIDIKTLDVITKQGNKSIKDVIKDQLEKLQDPKKQLSSALHYLSTAVVLEEQVSEIAAKS
jgi:hypothetical protein